jgi:hypothetical protein
MTVIIKQQFISTHLLWQKITQLQDKLCVVFFRSNCSKSVNDHCYYYWRHSFTYIINNVGGSTNDSRTNLHMNLVNFHVLWFYSDKSLLLVINVVNLKCDVFIYVKKKSKRKRINILHNFLLLFLQGCFTSTIYWSLVMI